MPRPPNQYLSTWGDTEQPTTIISVTNIASFGNLITIDTSGWIVGMRFGYYSNATYPSIVGVVCKPNPDRSVVRVCNFKRPTPSVGGNILWCKGFIHPFLPIAAGDTYMYQIFPRGSPVSYNDGALLAGPLTIGHFTYPQNTRTDPNGAYNTGPLGYPTIDDNGRRYTIDVLFLPTQPRHP